MAKSVLLVEDEDNIAAALEIMVGRQGYAMSRVDNGGHAVAAITEQHPDLVILDVTLPEVSGYEICQRLRDDASFDDVKILMMTARGSEMDRRKGLALGADDFLAKPFAMKDFTDKISALLEAAPTAPAGAPRGPREAR
ncbi:Transcriptional regulatory protein YycF [Pseudoruegeria aquimaris]|uniref:Transcriptional regulatory protein YycF n=1 Tax=Pseudoruegeria aquimaris TaxID=393663 RepID=A0A1Y5SUI5_9RHOB|nr:response regulator [Pseudoruegeria aquimaris]SLN48640.1 Transcriptional regulatory protein YycF [Pseudoruegeria aquimaris]